MRNIIELQTFGRVHPDMECKNYPVVISIYEDSLISSKPRARPGGFGGSHVPRLRNMLRTRYVFERIAHGAIS